MKPAHPKLLEDRVPWNDNHQIPDQALFSMGEEANADACSPF